MANYIHYLRNMVGHEKVILVAAGALVFNEEGHLLLQKRADNGCWGHPGGIMELGETVQETARREVFEETGLHMLDMELFGVYSGPTFDSTLANGDQVSTVKIIFTCRNYSGELACQDGESLSLRFFPLDQLPDNLFPNQQRTFEDLLSGNKPPFLL